MTSKHYDVIVVGAGIVGLAHALAAQRLGHSVLVIERSQQVQGASVRNFGMFLPIGMPLQLSAQVERSRQIWLSLLQQAGLWHNPCGALLVASSQTEMAVIEEYAQVSRNYCPAMQQVEVLTVEQATQRCSGLHAPELQGALYSPTEMVIDSRQVLSRLPALLQQQYAIDFLFDTTVTHIAANQVVTTKGELNADRILICCGHDFETLFPESFKASGMLRCKLQMLKTRAQPGNWKMGPMLATGLSLVHYPAFSQLKALPALQQYLEREYAELLQYGIHILVSQNGDGELIIGDSHEYDWQPSPFDSERIYQLIEQRLQGIFQPPELIWQQRWHGIYAKHPDQPYVELDVLPGVKIVTGFGGSGMTLSFGVAESVLAGW